MTAPTYSCDHCGTTVDLNATRCPGCGKSFDAVKCPRCGHQGSPSSFSNGCPRCGYLATSTLSDNSPRGRAEKPSLFIPVMGVLSVLLLVALAISWALRVG